ncbi:MAG: hypothetical protein INR73_22695 [Williamsia sp.]|nr:hypothetical protein [Williamsia sp.]
MYYSTLAINLYVHVFLLPLVMIVSVLAGMLFRSAQLKKAKNQVLSLENEMLNNHAEILRLQRELAVEKSSPRTSAPVVLLNEQRPEEKDKPDLAVKKNV